MPFLGGRGHACQTTYYYGVASMQIESDITSMLTAPKELRPFGQNLAD